MEPPEIRQALDADWPRISEICRLTSPEGASMPPHKHRFFEGLWIEPYRRLTPELTYVACLSGRAEGYLTGCTDTPGFETRKRWSADLRLALKYLPELLQGRTDVQTHWRRWLGLERRPEEFFSANLRSDLLQRFPAHLHINVAPGTQSRGLGRLLINHFFEELASRRVQGAHLYCGQGPVAFYKKLGFDRMANVTLPSGAEIFCMARQTEIR